MSPAGRIATISALLLGTAAAQSGSSIIDSLQPACKSAATQLVATSFAGCADITDLVAVLSATGSVITPLTTWTKNLCAQPACSSDVVSAASSSIQGNCSSDIASGNLAAVALNTITTNFDDVKNLVCLQSTSNSTSCLINFLDNVQTSSGEQLTIDNLEKMASASGIESLLSTLPQGDVCTDCNSAVMNSLSSSSILNSSESSQLKSAAQQECGSSFGTSMPKDVAEASSGARVAVALGTAALAGLAFAF